MKIELHIITNCTRTAPSTLFIQHAYESFMKTFGDLKTIVWCDPHPKEDAFDEYCDNLRKLGLIDIRQTGSLAESYLGVIEQSKCDYVFVLEHDWIFCHDRIKHTLDEILLVMQKEGLYYLRFNQVANYVRGWDRTLEEKSCDGFKYLESNCWSGNPHILDIKKCQELQIAKRIRNRGKKTPEKMLTDERGLSGHIYGGLNYPETILHLDGRGHTPKPHWTPRQRRMMAGKNLHRNLNLVVCMPWHESGCDYRQQSKKYLEKHYSEYPLFIGDSSQNGKTLNRSSLRNKAAKNAFGLNPDLEVLFFVDADTFIPMSQLMIACCLAKAEQRVVIPYDIYVRLDHRSTKIRLRGGTASAGKRVKGHVSGGLAVPASLFKELGGFDQRFKTWGGEDRAFFFAAQVLAGDDCLSQHPEESVIRVPGLAYHFYHPKPKDRNKSLQGYKDNMSLALQYKKASGINNKTGILPAVEPNQPDPEKMTAIMSGPGGPLDPNLVKTF